MYQMKKNSRLTGYQVSPSHDGRIFSDELISRRIGWWQANG
jgi:hypothetical protein